MAVWCNGNYECTGICCLTRNKGQSMKQQFHPGTILKTKTVLWFQHGNKFPVMFGCSIRNNINKFEMLSVLDTLYFYFTTFQMEILYFFFLLHCNDFTYFCTLNLWNSMFCYEINYPSTAGMISRLINSTENEMVNIFISFHSFFMQKHFVGPASLLLKIF